MYLDHTIALVIPCLNEEEGIRKILERRPDWIDEIVVADNGSTDGTVAAAKSLGAVVVMEPRRGYGRAFQAGLKGATADILIGMDGDDSYPIEEAEPLIAEMIAGGYDFVTGSRYPLSDGRAQNKLHRAANLFISSLVRRLFRIRLVDSQSGMMIFRRKVLSRIWSEDPGMGFSQEIKIRAFRDPRLKCAEKHIRYTTRTGKVKFHPTDGLKNLVAVLRLFGRFMLKRV